MNENDLQNKNHSREAGKVHRAVPRTESKATPELSVTLRCERCRFWSDRLAWAEGGGPVKAVCLVSGGPFSGQYTAGYQGCALGKSNQWGAVDCRGEEEEIAQLYAEDDAALALARGDVAERETETDQG